jgi:hypothetical protein
MLAIVRRRMRRVLRASPLRDAAGANDAREGTGARRAVFLLTGDPMPPPGLLAQHPGLVVARIPDAAGARFPGGIHKLYLVDPLGNLVLAYPENPDIKGIAKDLTRLLKASQIG